MILPFALDLTGIFETVYQILAAGVAITAVALMMYATSFNIHDRLVQTYILLLACVVLIYVGEAMASVSNTPTYVEFLLQMKWVGLVMLPAVYLHFSDALLTLTGRPSRGRRRTVVLVIYILSVVMAVLIPFGITVGGLAPEQAPGPYLERNTITFYFGIFYILVMLMVSYNMLRVVRRSATRTSQRRLFYLMAGAAAPALTSILFLFHGNLTLASHPDFFWLVSIVASVITGFFLIVMAYVVSYFGLNWTERAVKSRLLRWMLRGPFVAAIVLGMTTIVRRFGESQGVPNFFLVPVVMVAGFLVLEYAITLASPYLEKAFFWGEDRADLEVIQSLQDRMLTGKDLDQFLEMVSASICDRLQVKAGFIAVLEGGKIDRVIQTGDKKTLTSLNLDDSILQEIDNQANEEAEFQSLGDLYVARLEYANGSGNKILLGLCGFLKYDPDLLEEEDLKAVRLLIDRATIALKDRAYQQQVLRSITSLQLEVDYIQDLRASASYNQQRIYNSENRSIPVEMTEWVKDALTHYWGGPKLTNNPLMNLKVVETASEANEGNRVNALRSIIKEAIEKIRPEGERKFTSDWLLYNILDLKFLQGKKVREVARKLSVSEADLYRKQKVALESVAQVIADMELDGTGVLSGQASETEPSHTNLDE
ncbi:MAG TPA: histidine kinase N-terminal 7TM domain-containing protein [Anaerolineaceae bacterium]|nr:histidine kinase N-terminal 7TM domain-containing protein [Anaerolineaceae bacterium]HQJ33492.1 histidine kinase N-terminal 7TM domain-containing protein [Anaerolineaceae bacterium]